MGVAQRPLSLALLDLMRIGALQRAGALNRRDGRLDVAHVRLTHLACTRIKFSRVPGRVDSRLRGPLSSSVTRRDMRQVTWTTLPSGCRIVQLATRMVALVRSVLATPAPGTSRLVRQLSFGWRTPYRHQLIGRSRCGCVWGGEGFISRDGRSARRLTKHPLQAISARPARREGVVEIQPIG